MTFKSTLYLQHTSILKMMAVLGYVPRDISICKGFKKERKKVEGVNFVSFSDAQELHNGVTIRICGSQWDMLDKHLKLPSMLYQIAFQHKLVEKTYLQKSKSGLIVQNHQVKFTEGGKDYILAGKAGKAYSWAEDLFKENNDGNV